MDGAEVTVGVVEDPAAEEEEAAGGRGGGGGMEVVMGTVGEVASPDVVEEAGGGVGREEAATLELEEDWDKTGAAEQEAAFGSDARGNSEVVEAAEDEGPGGGVEEPSF